jgi:peptidoglycan-associated lipoprotein
VAKQLGGDVLFAYDSYTLGDSQRTQLQATADFLRRRTAVRVTIEGHADARGTNEYNLALGERRANAVKDYLVSLGVGGDRLSVESKGEEQQVCSEQSESCWSQNRRGHFVVTAIR